MIKTINKAFILLKENIVIVQPLIFYLLLIGFVAKPISFSLTQNLPSLLAIITVFLFTCAFLAGWFYIIKIAISMKNEVYETPEEKNLAAFSLLKQFFTGVGEYFVPVIFGFLFYIIALVGFSILSYKLGVHYIGKVELTPELIKVLNTGSYQDTYNFFNSTVANKQSALTISYWGFYVSALSLLFSFISLYFGAAIMYDTNNPFKAIFLNLKFLFLNFGGSIIILLFLSLLNMIISILSMFASMNIIFSIISLLLMFFYMSYHVMLVFLYYEEKTQDSCDSGTERIGEV